MGKDTKIEWADHTWNPVRGCAKVSPGCANCYAEAVARRNPKVLGTWGPDGMRVVGSRDNLRLPHRWARAAKKAGRKCSIFACSMADLLEPWPRLVQHDGEKHHFLDQTQRRVRESINATMYETQDWCRYLLLTKRPHNHAHLWPDYLKPRNAYWGTSIENEDQLVARLEPLARIKTGLRWLSLEPLLGPLPSLGDWLADGWFEWVIVGGESGPRARPMDPDWARQIRDACDRHGVPFFMKQMGGPSNAKGGSIEDIPEDLRIREFPWQLERRAVA